MSGVPDLFPGFAEATLQVDQAELAFLRAGTGPALLLLHGYPQTRAAWHRVAPRLAHHFTVIVLDLPCSAPRFVRHYPGEPVWLVAARNWAGDR